MSTLVLEMVGDVIDGMMLSERGVLEGESDTATGINGNGWLEEKDAFECARETVVEKVTLETTGDIAFVHIVGVRLAWGDTVKAELAFDVTDGIDDLEETSSEVVLDG